jgi:hypothetical protein
MNNKEQNDAMAGTVPVKEAMNLSTGKHGLTIGLLPLYSTAAPFLSLHSAFLNHCRGPHSQDTTSDDIVSSSAFQ